jgi:hypothetical protein
LLFGRMGISQMLIEYIDQPLPASRLGDKRHFTR